MEESANEAELKQIEDELLAGPAKGSVISAVQIGTIRVRGDLAMMRYLQKLWKGDGIYLTTLFFVHKAAAKIGLDPLNAVTPDHLRTAQLITSGPSVQQQNAMEDNALLGAMGYIIAQDEHASRLSDLVVHHGITDIDRLKSIVDNSDGASASLTEGML